MEIKLASVDDAFKMAEYYTQNEEHLRPWEPLKDRDFYSSTSWIKRLAQRKTDQQMGRAAYFLTYEPETQKVIATCSLTSVMRGSFLACYMSYSVAKAYEGKGVMKALCKHAISYAFEDLNLNRIMANYLPRNERSEILLASLGFEKEGLAKNYMRINGKWEDHVLTSLLNPTKP